MTIMRNREYPVKQIMKQCGLFRPVYLLFFPIWLGVCITNILQSLVVGNAIDQISKSKTKDVIVMATICILCTLVSYLFSIFNRYVMNHCVEGHIRTLRMTIGEKLVNVPYVMMESMQRGDVLSRTMGDLEKIQVFFEQGISGFILTTMAGLIGITISFYTGWKPTLAVLITIPIIALINIITTKSMEHLMMVQKVESGRANGIAMNYLQQLTSIKAFNLELLLSGNYFKQLKKIQKAENQIAMKQAALSFIQCLGGTLVYITMVVVGGLCVLRHEITPGQFVIILMLMQPLGAFAYEIQGFINSYKECKTGARRILDLMNLPEEYILPTNEERVERKELKEPFLELRHVSFAYSLPNNQGEMDHKVLKDISFSVGKGQKIAVVGSSGCGKSTLLKLICGLYKVSQGEIELDGILYQDQMLEQVRDKIAVVLQENYLFPMSIAENIRCGRPEASMDEIMETAKKVGIHEFIESLPNGYDTVLSDEGNNLSGGQRQRICIARAYIKKPELLVLDEPTAALDTETEHRVQQSLEQLMEGKTTITVAHRLSTILHSDLIYCMEDGKIVERGTHEELYERRGRYYQLYQIQEEMAVNA